MRMSDTPLEKLNEAFEVMFKKETTKPQPQLEPIPFAGLVNLEEDTDGNQTKSN